ncbi:hypothetical protein [Microcoleus sp. B9-D4]|uniref:hypothetical protein n=1 Tax=Microcoleus sp. B9-D4 TaxID=2818711 RepID=UPI002FD76057
MVRRHQKSGSTTNNLTATHHTQLVGCVATKNREAPPKIGKHHQQSHSDAPHR